MSYANGMLHNYTIFVRGTKIITEQLTQKQLFIYNMKYCQSLETNGKLGLIASYDHSYTGDKHKECCKEVKWMLNSKSFFNDN